MDKFIEVYDNVFSPELVSDIEQKVLYQVPYLYRHNITNNSYQNSSPGFFKNFYDGVSANKNTEDISDHLNQILYGLCSYNNINLLKILTGRIFLQLPLDKNNAISNNIHTDLHIPHWVCLYYVTDSDGDTILYKDDEETEIQRVCPKKGRVVFFDGSIKHCSSHPTKTHRAVVNFDFIGEPLGI